MSKQKGTGESMSAPFSLTNEQLLPLIESAKSNDQAAFEELLSLYSPLLESSVAGFLLSSPSLDEGELNQEALIAFHSAVLTFDPTQGASFGFYAKECIKNRLISYLRSEKRRLEFFFSEDELRTLPAQRNTDPTARLSEEEGFSELYQKIKKQLTPYENKVWWLSVAGRTAKEIAPLVGKDEKSVTNAIYRIRKKLRRTIPCP